MIAKVGSWENWYEDLIEVKVDEPMLRMLSRQLHIELCNAIQDEDYETAEQYIEQLRIMERKLDDRTGTATNY